MNKLLLPITVVALLSACSLSFSMYTLDAGMYDAIATRRLSRVKELVEEEKVDVNEISKNWVPLALACAIEDMNIITYFLNNPKIDINKKMYDESTALSVSCYKHNLYLVILLLSIGANVDQDSLKEAQNKPEVLRLLNLAQDLDNSDNRLKFVESQSDATDQEFLRKRLLKKHGIRVERTRIKKLLEEDDERVTMNRSVFYNQTIRFFKCII